MTENEKTKFQPTVSESVYRRTYSKFQNLYSPNKKEDKAKKKASHDVDL